jgi:putative glutamine amidotransferase
MALVAAADDVGLPILGICRGAQLLNVAAGGTLVQHLPDLSSELHRVPAHDCEAVHAVVVEPSSRLARITGGGPLGVNSLHHQAVGHVAPGWRPVAWSPDGVIEAIERIGACQLGVQWHPELLVGRREQGCLFAWLVAEAAAWRDGRLAPAGDTGDLVAADLVAADLNAPDRAAVGRAAAVGSAAVGLTGEELLEAVA